MAEIRVLQVIEVSSCEGAGTDKNPLRTVREYFAMDGTRLAKSDPFDFPLANQLRASEEATRG